LGSAILQEAHLADFQPPRPGMVRVGSGGAAIDLEVWELAVTNYGVLVAAIPAPLGIGRVQLLDGSWVQGFFCESYATERAVDISRYGGWRGFLRSRAE
jgi:allophanate hydrolase